MTVSTFQIALYLVASAGFGALAGWLLRAANCNRIVDQLNDGWKTKLDDVIRQRDRLNAEIQSLRSTIEAQQSVMSKHEVAAAKSRTDLDSAHEKAKLMSKDLFSLRAEREEFKNKVATFQNALVSVKQQSADLQAEFVKSGEFYKRELAKAFEKRKTLEIKVDNAKLEHESFSNLLQSARSEHESVNNMLASARNRLKELDGLEKNVIELEAENAQLNHDARMAKQETEALQRDVAELNELKVQNKELAHCLKSLETSRKQYEDDAKRYREHAGQSEQQSETLRIKLDEVEQNFAEMEVQQRKALDHARNAAVAQKSNGKNPPRQAVDDLKEIVGIGKVFEHTLNELGIYSFRQIANFGVSDIARVNAQLKEFKGRMEQDDWIGQAKELHFKKYGEIEES